MFIVLFYNVETPVRFFFFVKFLLLSVFGPQFCNSRLENRRSVGIIVSKKFVDLANHSSRKLPSPGKRVQAKYEWF